MLYSVKLLKPFTSGGRDWKAEEFIKATVEELKAAGLKPGVDCELRGTFHMGEKSDLAPTPAPGSAAPPPAPEAKAAAPTPPPASPKP